MLAFILSNKALFVVPGIPKLVLPPDDVWPGLVVDVVDLFTDRLAATDDLTEGILATFWFCGFVGTGLDSDLTTNKGKLKIRSNKHGRKVISHRMKPQLLIRGGIH